MPRTRKDYISPVDEKLIGTRLRELRKRRGMTQVELAQELGITQSQISDYENGAVRLHGALLAAFAKALNATSDELLGLDEPRAPTYRAFPRAPRRAGRSPP